MEAIPDPWAENDPAEGTLCTHCREGHYHYGIMRVESYGNGPVEIHGVVCNECGFTPFEPQEEFALGKKPGDHCIYCHTGILHRDYTSNQGRKQRGVQLTGSLLECHSCGALYPYEEKEMSNTTETLNIFHAERGVKLIEVQAAINASPMLCKVGKELAEVELKEDDYILVESYERKVPQIARVINPDPDESIVDQLDYEYVWAFQKVDMLLLNTYKKQDQTMRRAIVNAEAIDRAESIRAKMPQKVQNLLTGEVPPNKYAEENPVLGEADEFDSSVGEPDDSHGPA